MLCDKPSLSVARVLRAKAAVAAFALAWLGAPLGSPAGLGREAGAQAACPKGMVSIQGKYCIDAYEAATVEIAAPRKGKKKPKVLGRHSPFEPVSGLVVMAVSEKGRVPQAHISRDEAEQACVNAGKRLCTDEEWLTACRGKRPTKYPYGDEHQEGACNDQGTSGFNKLFGPGNNEPPDASLYTVENMNDPRLNQLPGTVARTGSFAKCRNAFKVHDMVGNLHEWTAAKEGTFRGGYYLDTHINGEGCDYRTTAHDGKYHDYSTGFRCCQGGAEQARLDKARREKEREADERAAREKAEAKARKKAEVDAKKKAGEAKPKKRADAKGAADSPKKARKKAKSEARAAVD